MRRYRRISAPDYIIYGLLAIGIVSRFVYNPGPFIIPLLVFGIIFLLYKFPPNRIMSRFGARSAGRSFQTRRNVKVKRKSNFRVIYGNKPNPEDEPPQYH